jgi:hypothetical protein
MASDADNNNTFEDESTSRRTDLAAPSDRSNTRSAFLHGQQQQVLGLQKYKYEYEVDGGLEPGGDKEGLEPGDRGRCRAAPGGHTAGMTSNTVCSRRPHPRHGKQHPELPLLRRGRVGIEAGRGRHGPAQGGPRPRLVRHG